MHNKQGGLFYFKKNLLSVVIILLLILCAAVGTIIGERTNVNHREKATEVFSWHMFGRRIVVDAGHGGFDPGAIGITGVEEKDITLAISSKVADLLRQSGALVTETRTSDMALGESKKDDMAARVAIGKQSGAELFLMIHGNATNREEYHGAQVFYYKDSLEGACLAGCIQNEISRLLNNTNRSVLALQGIYVMRQQSIPVVIVEVGFLSNAEEEKLLCDEFYQQQIAWAIYSGVVKYYQQQNETSAI